MKTQEWKWKTKDGLQMYANCWMPDRKAKAVVVLIHGMGEHVGRYAHVGVAFTKAGYALAGFDLRGHGKSQGPRGHTPSYMTLVEDIVAFLSQVEKRFPKVPKFLYGHSLGGILALSLVLRRKPDIRGGIVTAPWLRTAFQPPAYKVALGRLMNNIVPGFSQPSGLETAALSRDPKVVHDYENDPLVHDRISARFFIGVYSEQLWLLEHAAQLSKPILLIHGGADRLTSVDASREFARAAGSKVTLSIWDDWYHEVHNEPEKARVFKAMLSWLVKLPRK